MAKKINKNSWHDLFSYSVAAAREKQCMKDNPNRTLLLNNSTSDIWGGSLERVTVLGIIGCVSSIFGLEMPAILLQPSWDNQKYLQTQLKVPWEPKSPPLHPH
jgi:hypothetical protein